MVTQGRLKTVPLPSAKVSFTPLRILHVAVPAPVGGLERVVQALAIGHRARGHDVHVAAVTAPDPDPHPFITPLEQAGVTVHRVVVEGRGYLTERRAVRELCRTHRFDVVHTHGYRASLIDAGVARRLGIPTVTTVHGSSRMGGLTHLYEWLETRSFRRFDAVIAVSSPLVRSLTESGVPKPKLHLLRNAWGGEVKFLSRDEARDALGLPQEDFLVGWVGRMILAKGPDLFVRAMESLADLPLSGVMIGDGPELAQLQARNSTIRFLGAADNAAPYFKAFDLFVLSSRTEGTPIVLFEAMAAEVPIVAFRVGGVGDLLGEDQVMVPPGDVVALAGAILSTSELADEGAGRAAAARERLASAFASGPWLDQHEEIYREIQPFARRQTTV